MKAYIYILFIYIFHIPTVCIYILSVSYTQGTVVGFGLASKCGNPSTNTLKKTKTKMCWNVVHALMTYEHIVLPGFSDVLSVRLPQAILSTPFNQF